MILNRTSRSALTFLFSSLAASALFLSLFAGAVHADTPLLSSQIGHGVTLLAQAAPATPKGVPSEGTSSPEAQGKPEEVRPAGEAPQAPAAGGPAGVEAPLPAETKPQDGSQPGVGAQQLQQWQPLLQQMQPQLQKVQPQLQQIQPQLQQTQPQPQQTQPLPGPPKRGFIPRQPMQQAGGPVSFFFDDADIFEVIQTVFGDVLKANYIIDPKVKGKVTFRTVTPIPKEEVLTVMEIILRINGVGFVEEKGLYRIVPITDVPSELVYAQVGKEPNNVAIELFTFKNMNIKESMSDIQNVIGLNVKGESMRVLPIQRLNALLVVASTKEQMEYVRGWVEVFDSMFAEARPKVTVYPLQNSKADRVAQMLQSILGTGGGSIGGGAPAPKASTATSTSTSGAQTTPSQAPKPVSAATGTAGGSGSGFLVSPDTKIFADEFTNSLVILSTPGDYAFIEETIKKIDTVARQVIIEGLLVRVDITDNMDFGMQWAIQNNATIQGFTKNGMHIQGPLNLNTLITPDALQKPAMFQFTALDAAGNVKLALQSLATLGKAKILASPHILVSDNREAHIQVGQQIPLATSTTTEPLAASTLATSLASTSTIQYKDIGIILKVKPQINDSGLVSLEVTQEVSSQGADVNIAGQAFASINKTEVGTNLVAKDGETIIIGGLIREDTNKARSGIPFLSRIPILGYLFGSTNDDTARSELIILLTPHVARNLQEASDMTSEYIEKYKGVTKDKSIEQFIQERSKKGQKGNSGGDSGTKDAQ